MKLINEVTQQTFNKLNEANVNDVANNADKRAQKVHVAMLALPSTKHPEHTDIL